MALVATLPPPAIAAGLVVVAVGLALAGTAARPSGIRAAPPAGDMIGPSMNPLYVLIEATASIFFIGAAVAALRRGRLPFLELISAAAFGILLEEGDQLVFETYHYSTDWILAIDRAPIVIGLTWALIIAGAMRLTDALGVRRRYAPFVDAVLALSLDLAFDAIAIRMGLWTWREIGPTDGWFGVPAGNFYSWLFVTLAFSSLTRWLRMLRRATALEWLQLAVPLPAFGLLLAGIVPFAVLHPIVDPRPGGGMVLFLIVFAAFLAISAWGVWGPIAADPDGERLAILDLGLAFGTRVAIHGFFIAALVLIGAAWQLPVLLVVAARPACRRVAAGAAGPRPSHGCARAPRHALPDVPPPRTDLPMSVADNAVDWDRATAECVEHLQALIRIPSVNPPGVSRRGRRPGLDRRRDGRGQLLRRGPGLGRDRGRGARDGAGSRLVLCRLPATVPERRPPLVLLSHLDVVPVDAESWTHDPFGGELIDGVIWGRGAVDMKDMVAMELSVMLALARFGGERSRDVIFAAVADEEAGGDFGAGHWVSRAPGPLRRCRRSPRRCRTQRGRWLLDDDRRPADLRHPGRREGDRLDPDARHRHHRPCLDATRRQRRPEAGRGRHPAGRRAPPARVTPVVDGIPGGAGPREVADAIRAGERGRRVRRPRGAGRRSGPASIARRDAARHGDDDHDPGRQEGERHPRQRGGGDRRPHPARHRSAGASSPSCRPRVGDLAQVEPVITLPAIEAPGDAPIVDLMRAALLAADPDALAAPMMITPGTDAKALATIGIPTYGFAPLQLGPEVPFLSLFHGHDERVPVSALRFGLPVLHEVVSRFAAP